MTHSAEDARLIPGRNAAGMVREWRWANVLRAVFEGSFRETVKNAYAGVRLKKRAGVMGSRSVFQGGRNDWKD